MPCLRCNTDFNFFNWKLKCYECEEYYCSKCLKKQDGLLFCETCIVLNKRPPNRAQLMELKSKDLQQYLNKNNVSTHGLVEKQELVELFCRHSIPVHHRKFPHKLSSNLGGSVPNLASRSQSYLNSLRSNAEAAFYTHARNVWPPQNIGPTTSPTPPRRNIPTRPPPPPPPPPTYMTNRQSATNSNTTNGDTSSIPTATAPPTEDYDPPVRKYPKLSDFETEEELSDLSVKQLKEILQLNRVDYKGCVEKGELLERATRLWSDSKQHKNDNFDGGIDECCKICMDAPLDCVLLECGHIATCIDCGKQLAECPICRQYVTRVVRTFKA